MLLKLTHPPNICQNSPSFIPSLAQSHRDLITGVQKGLDWFVSYWIQNRGRPSAVWSRRKKNESSVVLKTVFLIRYFKRVSCVTWPQKITQISNKHPVWLCLAVFGKITEPNCFQKCENLIQNHSNVCVYANNKDFHQLTLTDIISIDPVFTD